MPRARKHPILLACRISEACRNDITVLAEATGLTEPEVTRRMLWLGSAALRSRHPDPTERTPPWQA